MSPEFLVFTNKTDLTSDFIIREMRRRSLRVLRINTEEIFLWNVIQDGDSGTILRLDRNIIELGKVRAAYFRRPLPPEISSKGLPSSTLQYLREEWSYMLRSIYLELDKKWFSHPNAIILAEDKPKQLRLAKEIGFNIPHTVITNDLQSIKKLFLTGPVIAKPLKQALLEDSENERVIFTSTIESLSDVDENALRAAPVIFQRKILKKYDIRVTVVEDDVFSVSIQSQEFENTKTDWRHGSVIELQHDIFELPAEIKEHCKEIVRKLGLRFGAIDLVLDEAKKFWFLECNPNGQWAWIENRTGLPIAAAIVDSMERFP